MEIPKNIKLPPYMQKDYKLNNDSVDLEEEQTVSAELSTDKITEESAHKGHPNFIRSKNDGTANYYTKIDSRILKNEELDFLSIGIMAWMLSQDDTFKIFKETVRRNSKFGSQKFNKAWEKLEKLNYIIGVKDRNERGQYLKTHWIVNEDNTVHYSDSVLIEKLEAQTSSDAENRNSYKIENHDMENHRMVNHTEVNHLVENDKLIKNQINQNQINHDQLMRGTNGSENSARYTDVLDKNSLPGSLSEPVNIEQVPVTHLNYQVENPTRIEDIPQLTIDQIDTELYAEISQYSDREEVRRVYLLYSYLIHKNIHVFNFPDAKDWKMNALDYSRFYHFCNDQTVNEFSHLLYLADSIVEKAYKAKNRLKYITVAYITSQFDDGVDPENPEVYTD